MFKNFGLTDKIFGKRQIVVPTAEEAELFNYMPLGKVCKLVDCIVDSKHRENAISISFTYTYNGVIPNKPIIHAGSYNPWENISTDNKLLCALGKIVWGFKDRSYIGGSTQSYQLLSLPRDYYKIMDLDINIIEALQCTLNNAQQKYNNNIALLEIPEFSLKGCKISGM